MGWSKSRAGNVGDAVQWLAEKAFEYSQKMAIENALKRLKAEAAVYGGKKWASKFKTTLKDGGALLEYTDDQTQTALKVLRRHAIDRTNEIKDKSGSGLPAIDRAQRFKQQMWKSEIRPKLIAIIQNARIDRNSVERKQPNHASAQVFGSEMLMSDYVQWNFPHFGALWLKHKRNQIKIAGYSQSDVKKVVHSGVHWRFNYPNGVGQLTITGNRTAKLEWYQLNNGKEYESKGTITNGYVDLAPYKK